MLSRRNSRIKVMQLLYAKNRDASLNLVDLLKRYNYYGVATHNLYLYSIQQIVDVARGALYDSNLRKAKMLPTPADKLFKPTLYENAVLQQFLEESKFIKLTKQHGLTGRTDTDLNRVFYMGFLETPAYKNYLLLEEQDRTEAIHKIILLDIYKYLLKRETFIEQLVDFSPSWIDDESLIVASVKKLLKGLPQSDEFIETFNEEDVETLAFGKDLLRKTYEKDAEILELIKPELQNWDSERVATLDMVMMKMAITEMTDFPSIPTKVTINEYVEISKVYSTDKSREFINGILDKLLKLLGERGSIQKAGRGLVDS